MKKVAFVVMFVLFVAGIREILSMDPGSSEMGSLLKVIFFAIYVLAGGWILKERAREIFNPPPRKE